MKKIGLTGATGHIGGVLSNMLLEAGYEVGALVYNDASIHPQIKEYKGTITNTTQVNSFVKEYEYIIHLAAKISVDGKVEEMYATNVEGTKNVIDACRKHNIKRLIHFTSIAAISQFPLDRPLDESNKLIGENNIGTRYGKSKSAGEKEVLKAVASGMNIVMIAPTSVMGPFDKKPSVLGQSLMDIYNNSIPALVEGGQDWVDVRDICKGTIAALEKGKSGEKYLLGSQFLTLKEVSDIISDAFDRKTPQAVLPFWMARLGIPFEKLKSWIKGSRNGFTNEALNAIKYANQNILHTKAKNDLGYEPMPVKQSIIDTINWFKAKGMIE